MKVQTRNVCHRCGGYAPGMSVEGGGWVCPTHDPDKIENSASSSSGLPPTLEVAPPSSGVLTDGVSIDVDVDIGTSASPREKPKSGSKRFDVLEKDAQKLGCRPLAMNLPDDLPPAQSIVAKDFAYVAGAYATLDGMPAVLEDGVPYSKRWRTDALGLSDITISRALRALEKRGVLIDRGETEPDSGQSRGTKLYAPGPRFL